VRQIAENLLNFTRNSNLYCVWVSAKDNGRERLVAIWIDRAMTAFKLCATEIAGEIGMAGIAAEHQQGEEGKFHGRT
jgi:hypothetical protein